MSHNSSVLGRRGFLAGAVAAPFARRGAGIAAPAGRRLRLVYEASNAAPWLVPPLRLDPPARLALDFLPGIEGAVCILGVRARLGETPGVLPLAGWSADEPTYWRAREAYGLPLFRGAPRWSGERWTLEINGSQAFAAKPGTAGAGSAPHAKYLPYFSHSVGLAPDWRQGPLDPGPAELWELRLRPESQLSGIPATAVEAQGSLHGWLRRLGATGPVAATVGAGPARLEWQTRLAATISPETLAPFAFRSYRPGPLGLVPATSASLTEPELEAYRQRKLNLSDLLIVSVDAAVDGEVLAGSVPPFCVLPAYPLARVLTVRGLGAAELDEAWLLVQCAFEGRPAWYAAAHLRPHLVGSEFGREVLGYPTQQGAVDAAAGANRFSASVERHGQTLFRAVGSYGGFSTGTSLGGIQVLALRARRGPSRRRPVGELVEQPWYFQGRRHPVQQASLEAEFPAAHEPLQGAWGRLGGVQPYTAAVYDGAVMQRAPGRVVAEIEDIGRLYRDRCDGRLPWEQLGAPAGAPASG